MCAVGSQSSRELRQGKGGCSRQMGKNYKRSPCRGGACPSPKHPARQPRCHLPALRLLRPGVSASLPKDRQWKN